MIKKIGISTFLFFSLTFFSQTQIKVLDSENKNPVPYAKLMFKDKDYYKNTEENGEITLENNEEINHIESFGYENLDVSKQQNIYFLKPKFTDIKEIEISKPKFTQTYTIGNLKKMISDFCRDYAIGRSLIFLLTIIKPKKHTSRK
ncbi:hypothetical protein ACFOEQ_15945 [Chryseobacterium arachidis]|uniref:hypothetical protein n=1 Tax=Chryseobacterium arachidis TaxID=1416778 RepID=UPI00360F922F